MHLRDDDGGRGEIGGLAVGVVWESLGERGGRRATKGKDESEWEGDGVMGTGKGEGGEAKGREGKG